MAPPATQKVQPWVSQWPKPAESDRIADVPSHGFAKGQEVIMDGNGGGASACDVVKREACLKPEVERGIGFR